MEEEMDKAQIEKVFAKIKNLGRESDKLLVETRWYPMVIGGAWTAVVIAATKLFL